MNHIKQIPLDGLSGRDLLPLAYIEYPVSRIVSRNAIHFEREFDDLDYYDISALELDNRLVFALRAYCGAPPDTVDFLLPADLLGSSELRRVVTDIAWALRIPVHRIRWPEGKSESAQRDRDGRRRVS